MLPKILIVDDVAMFQELQKGFLKLCSVRVLTANNGVEALEMVRKERPDLIFMDLQMPVMNGAESCTKLKADPALSYIPVIMLTAEGKEDDKTLSVKAGCNAYITKPIDRNLYLEMARRYVPAIDRRDVRVSCRTSIKFKVFGVNLSGETVDVSAHGAYIATNYDVAAGAVLDLVFNLPEPDNTVIQTKGRIAWRNTKGDRKMTDLPEGFGVEFIALAEASRQALVRFVERNK